MTACSQLATSRASGLPDGKMLPMAGVFAHDEAGVVAKQIAAEIRGRQPTSRASS